MPPFQRLRSFLVLLVSLAGASLAAGGSGAGSQAPGFEAPEAPRLRLSNGCTTQPLWIAYEAGSFPFQQNIKVPAGSSHDFAIPDGLTSTRFWPKFGCNEQGTACAVGESGGPGQACSTTRGCDPPLDTKFEGTFGTVGQPCQPGQGKIGGCDYVDVSLVDGYTVPFRLIIDGDCAATAAAQPLGGLRSRQDIDCSALTVGKCPAVEDLGAAGHNVSLRAKNPDTGEEVGCYSPCSKLTMDNWNNSLAKGRSPRDAEVHPYCCPTPPETPETCRSGPVVKTRYVEAMHELCPDVYAYSYDDREGLRCCAAGTAYEMVFFCPGADLRSEEQAVLREENPRQEEGAKLVVI